VGLQIDVPAHSSGFVPLIPAGVTFCDSTNSQLYNDPSNNKTLAVVVTVLSAVAQAFPDALFHLGGDETSVVNGTACTYAYVAWSTSVACARTMHHALKGVWSMTLPPFPWLSALPQEHPRIRAGAAGGCALL
jgi:N-acetyl-beta-hexosaminidase